MTEIVNQERNILAQSSERIYYFDEMTYFEAINGLFMGTYDQWLALGGKSEPLFEDNGKND